MALQRILVFQTRHETVSSGAVRDVQVVIGHRSGASPADLPVEAARFLPGPPGFDLRARVTDLVDWMKKDHSGEIDPVVSAAMAHHQFEALHPFHDGNGRIGRLLIVIHLLRQGVLLEPTLTVSPWFEARRFTLYDRLLGVSTDGDWDFYVEFFAAGLQFSAEVTHQKMTAMVRVQASPNDTVRASKPRADSAQLLVDDAIGQPSFTVRAVEHELEVSYGRANGLIGQLCALGILAPCPRVPLVIAFTRQRS